MEPTQFQDIFSNTLFSFYRTLLVSSLLNTKIFFHKGLLGKLKSIQEGGGGEAAKGV